MSNEIKVVHATGKHKDFIVYANKVIDETNDMTNPSHLEENFENDYLGGYRKFECLVAEYNGRPVGMVLYSYFYWASDGQVLWISQMYVESKYRSKGVFFLLIEKLKEENKHIKIVSCATGNKNLRMQTILKYYKAVEMSNLKFYYKLI